MVVSKGLIRICGSEECDPLGPARNPPERSGRVPFRNLEGQNQGRRGIEAGVFAKPLSLARRMRDQRQKQRGRKVYSLNKRPRSNASARTRPYEFAVKLIFETWDLPGCPELLILSTSGAYFGYGSVSLAYRPATTKSATIRDFLAKPHNVEPWRATIPEPKALTSSETANSYDCIKSADVGFPIKPIERPASAAFSKTPRSSTRRESDPKRPARARAPSWP